MKVTISTNNNRTIKTLPIVLEDSVSIDYGQSSAENKDSIKYGQIKVLGKEPLASITIDSFFPTRSYPFITKGADTNALSYINWFRNNRKNRELMRVVITDEQGKSIFNRLMNLETFQITSRDQAGDYYYTMVFEQYRMVK